MNPLHLGAFAAAGLPDVEVGDLPSATEENIKRAALRNLTRPDVATGRQFAPIMFVRIVTKNANKFCTGFRQRNTAVAGDPPFFEDTGPLLQNIFDINDTMEESTTANTTAGELVDGIYQVRYDSLNNLLLETGGVGGGGEAEETGLVLFFLTVVSSVPGNSANKAEFKYRFVSLDGSVDSQTAFPGGIDPDATVSWRYQRADVGSIRAAQYAIGRQLPTTSGILLNADIFFVDERSYFAEY